MSDGLIFLQGARLSFPHIAAPQVQQDTQRAVYNADFLIPLDDPNYKKFIEAATALAAAKWGAQAQPILQMIYQDRRFRCFGSGEEKVNKKTFQPYDGYAGVGYISASRDKMPQIIDAQGNPIDPNNTMACQAEARKMYGGCFVNAVVKPWLQENKHGRGIRCDFVAVQFFKDGAAFGEGAVDVSGMFGAAPAAPAPAAAPPAMPWAAPAPFPAAPPSGNLPSFLS